MPKTNINYSNTIIYKLCCKDLSITDIYVGHTTDMRKRKWGHKSNCNNEKIKNYNLNVYQFIRNNGGWDNWEMIEIEKYPCNDRNEDMSINLKKIENAIGLDSKGRTIAERLDRVEHQLWENGGSSLADRVNTIEVNVVKTQAEIGIIKDFVLGVSSAPAAVKKPRLKKAG
jgi:hypothetical protein